MRSAAFTLIGKYFTASLLLCMILSVLYLFDTVKASSPEFCDKDGCSSVVKEGIDTQELVLFSQLLIRCLEAESRRFVVDAI